MGPRRGCAAGLCALALLLLATATCGGDRLDGSGGDDDDDGASADAGTSGQCFSSSECPVGWWCNDFGVCEPPPSDGDGGVPPPEVEYELSPPASSLRYVYVAMTDQDALARIDGETLSVSSIHVGEAPKTVATIPGADAAIVLDSVNGTATIVRATSGTDQKRTLATLPHLNRIDLDPSGRFAVVWFDLIRAIEEAGGLEVVDEVGSFQDVTVIDLAPGNEHAVDLTVGFRPREVEFDAAGDRAYVVTEDGVSVIDLAVSAGGAPTIVPPVPVQADPFGDATGVEVDVVSTGAYAVVREPETAGVRVVQLAGQDPGQSPGAAWDLPLPAVPTDIDLAPDGARLYAVLRDSGQLAIIDLPADALDPAGIEVVDLGVPVGSLVLSADGSRGLLFTNASLDERITAIRLDLSGTPYVTWPLEKSVRAVGFSPSGTSALVLHAKAFGDPGEASTVEEYIDRSYGYSLLDLATGFAKLQVTPVDPGAFAYAADGSRAYLALDGGDAEGAEASLQQIDVATGVVETIELGSPPSAVGVLPSAGMAFVSQRHPLGRVSFVDLGTGAVRTVTGFDLNSEIVD
jgi:DNA-binding beta-propeller fold protein YncE